MMAHPNTSLPGLPSRLLRILRQDEGSSLIELALLIPPLLLVLVGAIDFGRGYYVAIEVASAAEAGALYGSLNPTDDAGMRAAAVLDAHDVSTMTVTSSDGCECSDGTSAIVSCSATPSCAVNVVNYVEVDTAVTYTPILKYPGLSSSYSLTGKSRMRAGH